MSDSRLENKLILHLLKEKSNIGFNPRTYGFESGPYASAPTL